MADLFASLFARAQEWCERAQRAGWLESADAAAVAAVEQRSPADLFVDRPAGGGRPLVVAFFGGTGVGKSSLLNRLAGAVLARTGAERPTSREVTVYVHESVQLADLPPELPLDAVQIKRHASDAHRDVLWVDAPDIDSTEAANRRCALAWLPHVDLVCYVISPERYRDDVGWRVLRERGHKHGWLFVLNRWDEGDPRQVEDFARLLRDAGFPDPLVLPTCCVPSPAQPLPTPDEFNQIQAVLAELLRAHGVEDLARLGAAARLAELRVALQTAQRRLGDAAAWARVTDSVRENWRAATATIASGAEWSLRAVAARFAARDGGLGEYLRRYMSVAGGRTPAEPSSAAEPGNIVLLNELTGQLWDEWSQAKLNACLDAVEVGLRRAGLAATPVRRPLDAAGDSAGARVTQLLRDGVRQSLAQPGDALTRALRRGTGFLTTFLPTVALVWVAYAVLRGYHAAVQGQREFLGLAFAINSALVVLIAWAVPYALDRLLRPSLERAVLRALGAGLHAGLEDVGGELIRAVTAASDEAAEHRTAVDTLVADINRVVAERPGAAAPILARVTMAPAARDAEVRPEIAA
jgi:hypothetical protein